MVQRATAFSKKKAEAPVFASVSAADIIRAPVVHRAVPLDLLPLIKPLKRAGRLVLRIERMPQRAKLSAGQRNSDNSWSLASDELEGLNYLVPSNLVAEHELTIRVMRFDDGAASTLKVAQFPIPRWDGDDAADKAAALSPAEDEEEKPLRSQLGEMQSLFAVRESELNELRAALARAQEDKAAELAKAKAAWDAEWKQRLSHAEADKKQEHGARRAEEDKEKAADTERRIAAAREQWQAEADRHFDAERRRWEAEAGQRLDSERRKEQGDAEQRLKAEHERWQAEADRQFEAERRELEAQAQQRIEAERRGRQAEAGKGLEAERTRWQAEADRHLDNERRRLEALAEQRVQAQRADGQAEAERRLKAERERWQAETDRHLDNERRRLEALAEERVQAQRADGQAEAERRLKAEREHWQAEADRQFDAERRHWQTEADRRLETERTHWQGQAQSSLKQSEERWKAEEAARLTAALQAAHAEWRTEWRQESDRMLAEEAKTRARLEVALAEALAAPAKIAPASGDASALELLRQDLAAARKGLGERELEIARHRTEFEQERNRLQQAAEASMAETALVLKKEEAARAALTQARAQSEEALAAALSRAQEAERGLEQVRSEARNQAMAAARSHDDAYIERLRSDVARLEASLVSREAELGRLRASFDAAAAYTGQRPAGRPMRELRGEEEGQGISRSLMRDFAVAFVIIVGVILFYPSYAGYLPQGLRSGLEAATGGLFTTTPNAPPAPHSVIVPAPAPPPAAEHPASFVNRTVNVRAMPTSKSDTVASLPRNTKVTVLEQRGNWTLVEIPGAASGAGGKPQQGWVFNPYLGEKKTEAGQPVPADAPKPATNSAGAGEKVSATSSAATGVPSNSAPSNPVPGLAPSTPEAPAAAAGASAGPAEAGAAAAPPSPAMGDTAAPAVAAGAADSH